MDTTSHMTIMDIMDTTSHITIMDIMDTTTTDTDLFMLARL